MSLMLLIATLLLGGLLAWLSELWGKQWPRWISLVSLLLALIQLTALSFTPHSTDWIYYEMTPWVERFGVAIEVAVDGLSAVLLWLTLLLGVYAVLVSWSEIKHRIGFFHFNLLAVLAGVTGVFVALDLMLFFVFWEVMLLPMVVLVAVWGHEQRIYAAMKFFIFTQVSSLLLLLAIVAIAWYQAEISGRWSFSVADLNEQQLPSTLAWYAMLGFFLAFTVKLPSVPFHTWLPDAHTQAPTAGSVILAAILLKTGAYGLIRFVLPIFPEISQQFAPWAMGLAVVSILYGAKLAFAQQDMKRLVAYSSISHMGFVLLGIYSFQLMALQGAVVQMIAHGLSTAALFAVVGMLQERLHTRDLGKMSGLWQQCPRLGALTLFFVAASLGLPGLANFVAEFLVLLGTYQVAPLFAIPATLGLILAAVYSLMLLQKSFWVYRQIQTTAEMNHADTAKPIADVNGREFSVLAILLLFLIYFGLNPQPLLHYPQPALQKLVQPSPEHALAVPVLVADKGSTQTQPHLKEAP